MSTTIAEASVKITADIAELRAEIEAGVKSAVAGASATVKVEADTAEADGQLALFDAEVDAIGKKSVTVTVKTNTQDLPAATKDIDNASRGVGALATTVIALGPALIPITAGLVGFGAAGAVSLGALGLGAGVVALAFGAVKKEVTTELTPALADLKKVAADGILPGVKADIADLLPKLPKVKDLVASVSGELGTLAREGGAALGGPGFRGFFSYVDASAVPILDELGHVIGNVVEGAGKLAVGFAPVTAEVGAGLDSLTGRFAHFSTSSGGFQHFIAYVQTEGPVVVHTLAETGDALGHVLVALAPVGDAVLTIVRGFDYVVEHTPKPVIDALAVSLAAYVVVSKLASVATKSFGLSEEGAAAAAGPLTAALAVTIGALVEYEARKAQNATTDREAANAGAAYTASLKVNYTSTKSVAEAQGELRDRIAELTSEFGFLKASGADVGNVLHPLQLEITSLGGALAATGADSRQARTNAQDLAQQYGLTTHQVVALAGGSKNLIGPISTVGARFETLFNSARATHNPLSQAAKDEEILGNRAATAAQQMSALSDQLSIFAGNALETDAAALTFKDDIATLEAALKKSKGSFDSNTTAGRASAEALNSAALQAIALANASEKSGGSVEKTRKILQSAIGVLEQTAGGSKAARAQIDLLKAAQDHIPDSAKKAADGFHLNINQIPKDAEQAASIAASKLQGAVPTAKTAGLDFAVGYARGIASGQDGVITAAAGIAAAAVKTVQKTQQSSSPSKVMDREGHYASTGYAQGITAGIPEATKAAADLGKKSVAAAASSAKAEASKITSISDYLGLGFNTDVLGSAKQIRSGTTDLTDKINRSDLSADTKAQIDAEIAKARVSLVSLANTTDKVNVSFKAASSALQQLRQDAASVRSSTLSSFQGLGDPSQFNGITSVAGVNSVLGKQDALAEAFDKALKKDRAEGLDKTAYDQILAAGPGQDSSIAALLATATKAQIRQFNREEALLTSTGTTTGEKSATYLFGRQIAEQTKTVRELHGELVLLRHDQHELAKDLERVVRGGLKGAHKDAVSLIHAEQRVGKDVARGMSRVAVAAKQTRRARVAGARG